MSPLCHKCLREHSANIHCREEVANFHLFLGWVVGTLALAALMWLIAWGLGWMQ